MLWINREKKRKWKSLNCRQRIFKGKRSRRGWLAGSPARRADVLAHESQARRAAQLQQTNPLFLITFFTQPKLLSLHSNCTCYHGSTRMSREFDTLRALIFQLQYFIIRRLVKRGTKHPRNKKICYTVEIVYNEHQDQAEFARYNRCCYNRLSL